MRWLKASNGHFIKGECWRQ